MRARQSIPAAVWPLTIVACLTFGGLALLMGMDAGWDARHHAIHNGWAFLNGVVGRDVLAALAPGFLNPTLDAVHVLLTQALPARMAGFLLGALHGLNVPILFAIAWRMLDVRNPNRRMLAAGALALAGIVGAGGLSALGSTYLGGVLSLGVLAAVLGVVRHWEDLSDGNPPSAALIATLAGIPAGLSFGLMPPMAAFVIGLAAAFLFANLPLARRLWLMVFFLVGAFLGLALGGGHWMIHLWTSYSSPTFPNFNDLRPPPSLVELLTLGFRFPFDTALVSDTEFRDYRVLALIVLVPLAALASAFKRDRDPGAVTMAGPSGWLMAAALVSFAAWAALAPRYRHLVPLEMLAPLVIVTAVGALPLPRAARRGLAAAVVAFVTVTAMPGIGARTLWRDTAPVTVEAGTMALLTGTEPVSFLIPAFPRDTRFVRLAPAFSEPFTVVTSELVAAHPGPMIALNATGELGEATNVLAVHGLILDTGSCRPVDSPLAAEPFVLCPVTRPKPAVPATEPPPPRGAAASPSAADRSTGSVASPAPR